MCPWTCQIPQRIDTWCARPLLSANHKNNCVFCQNSLMQTTPLEHPLPQRRRQLNREQGLKQLPFSRLSQQRQTQQQKNILWRDSLCCRPWGRLSDCGKVPGLNSPATSRTRAWERGLIACPKSSEKLTLFNEKMSMERETQPNPRSHALVRDVAGQFKPGTYPQSDSRHHG